MVGEDGERAESNANIIRTLSITPEDCIAAKAREATTRQHQRQDAIAIAEADGRIYQAKLAT